MKYLNVIDENFDCSLFGPGELDRLHALVSANNDCMARSRSVRFPNVWEWEKEHSLELPKYAPPREHKFQILNTYDLYAHRGTPTKPEVPICPTNTELCNYVHKAYIYKQFLLLQLKRQRSYQEKLNMQRAHLKHNYDWELSRTMSRRMSQKSGRSIII